MDMEKTIRLKVRRELSAGQHHTVIKLKGSLISKGYTQIIHIEDQDEEFHLNSFEVPAEKQIDAREYITAFVILKDLSETLSITE